MKSSIRIDNKGKNFLILGKGPTSGLNHMIAGETQHSINFTRPGIKFCLSLHYNWSNIFLFVNVAKVYWFKTKDSEIKEQPLCLGNISGDFSGNSMKKTGLNGYVYDFFVDYRAFDTSNIINIHKYLMKKHGIK